MSYRIAKLGLGGILDQGVAIIRNHFGLLLGIMAYLFIPFYLVTGVIQVAMVPELPMDATVEEISDHFATSQNFVPFQVLFAIIGGLIVVPLTNAAVIDAVSRLYLGQSTTAGRSLKNGLRKIGPLIGTSILMGLAIMGGLILCIIPGVLFALWFGLAHEVVIVEGRSGTTALTRSKSLVRPHLGQFLVLGVLFFVINIAFMYGARFVPERHAQVAILVLLQSATTIFATAVTVVFYFSCRCAVDNFDLEHLAAAIGRSDEEAAAGSADPDAGGPFDVRDDR